MGTVLIVIYLLIVLALIVVILLQRSEGGGLGMSGGSGGLVSARGSANLLTRTTAILGTLFMVTAVGLTIVAELDNPSSAILDRAVGGDGAPVTVLDALDQLSGDDASLALPTDEATDTPAPSANEDPVTDGADLALPSGEDADLAVPDGPAADGADLALPGDAVPLDQTPVEEASPEQTDVVGSPAAEGGADLAMPETGEEPPPAVTQ